MIDYSRFARQVALPELGARGQALLSETLVAFTSASPSFREEAEALWERAGGRVANRTLERPSVVVALPDGPSPGVAAWGCVEAARRVLGEPPTEPSLELLERLSP